MVLSQVGFWRNPVTAEQPGGALPSNLGWSNQPAASMPCCTFFHCSPLPHTPPLPAPQLILGQPTPLPVILSLVPIMLGVAAASAAELSFNWMGELLRAEVFWMHLHRINCHCTSAAELSFHWMGEFFTLALCKLLPSLPLLSFCCPSAAELSFNWMSDLP